MIKKIEEIKNNLNNTSMDELIDKLNEYRNDERKSVQRLVNNYDKKIVNYHKELQRLENMKEYENKYNNYSYICGIDEAGRGPLAGPVVAASVVLPKECNILYLNDSKQISESKREELFDEILLNALSVGIGIVDAYVIDEINILQATYKAMKMAIEKMPLVPHLLLNDAVTIPDIDIKQVPIIKGDTKSVSIAAASIIAKVTRDRIMLGFDEQYPEYNFKKNKGYGTKEHIDSIKKFGISNIHRKTFVKNFI